MLKIKILVFIFICLSGSVWSFSDSIFALPKTMSKRKPFQLNFNKSGPYIGVQRGKYWVGEIGFEKQFKKVRLVNPYTHAFHTGFNYNLINNVLGYDLGYWYQRGRFNLPFGGNLVMRTNFDQTRVGIAPVIGFKLTQFHIQTGYHFLTRAGNFTETNQFFISLRFVLINERDLSIDRKKKDKKKTDDKKKSESLFKRDR
jgi:hypothetical protein